jgi:CRP-like cAMP-binding protein
MSNAKRERKDWYSQPIVTKTQSPASYLRPGERTGPEGKPINNRILLSFTDREFRAIRQKLEFTGLAHHGILHESHRKARNVYFLNEGLISLVVVMANGKTAEAGVVGNEGVVGLEALFGMRRSPLREVVQIAGTAHRIPGASVQALLRTFPGLLLRFSRFAVVNRMQISQTAACNRLHEVEKRLARWLLLTQDRVESGFIPMTHDFLATMLGTDRGSVTEAAGMLQKGRIIEYNRGSVRVLNRRALENASCECYELIREYNSELLR